MPCYAGGAAGADSPTIKDDVMRAQLLLSALLLCSACPPPATAKQGTLEQCQKVQDKIDHYTRLRRAGGSAKKMERLKQRRDAYRERFSERDCRRWRKQLR
ncbi:MAG: hypothetical protein AB2814_01605 [Candidatus Sedimenticola endophacoides]